MPLCPLQRVIVLPFWPGLSPASKAIAPPPTLTCSTPLSPLARVDNGAIESQNFRLLDNILVPFTCQLLLPAFIKVTEGKRLADDIMPTTCIDRMLHSN